MARRCEPALARATPAVARFDRLAMPILRNEKATAGRRDHSQWPNVRRAINGRLKDDKRIAEPSKVGGDQTRSDETL
jgi:hypothetical protein